MESFQAEKEYGYIDIYSLYAARWQESSNGGGSGTFFVIPFQENFAESDKPEGLSWFEWGKFIGSHREGKRPTVFHLQGRTFRRFDFSSIDEVKEASSSFKEGQHRCWQRVLEDKGPLD